MAFWKLSGDKYLAFEYKKDDTPPFVMKGIVATKLIPMEIILELEEKLAYMFVKHDLVQPIAFANKTRYLGLRDYDIYSYDTFKNVYRNSDSIDLFDESYYNYLEELWVNSGK